MSGSGNAVGIHHCVVARSRVAGLGGNPIERLGNHRRRRVLVLLVLCKHLQLSDGNDNVSVGSHVGKHVLITDARVHATAIGEDQHRELAFLTRHSHVHIHRVINHEVGQRALTNCHGLVRSAASVVGHFHLLHLDIRVVEPQMASIEGIHGRTSELQLLVVSHAVVAMHLHIIHRRASTLHLRHPVLREIRTHDRVFATLQHKDRCALLADIADRPPLVVCRPRTVRIANLGRRRTTYGTSHAARLVHPRTLGLVGESLALCTHSEHQGEVSSSRMTVSANAVGVDAQLLCMSLHPSHGTAHVLNAGWHRCLLRKAVVHICHHISLHGIINHQRAIDSIVLGASAPASSMNDEDGRSVGLLTEQGLCQVEHSAFSHIRAVRNVLRHGNLSFTGLCHHRQWQ